MTAWSAFRDPILVSLGKLLGIKLFFRSNTFYTIKNRVFIQNLSTNRGFMILKLRTDPLDSSTSKSKTVLTTYCKNIDTIISVPYCNSTVIIPQLYRYQNKSRLKYGAIRLRYDGIDPVRVTVPLHYGTLMAVVQYGDGGGTIRYGYIDGKGSTPSRK